MNPFRFFREARRQQRARREQLVRYAITGFLYHRPMSSVADIIGRTGLWGATLYVALLHMERRGEVRSQWSHGEGTMTPYPRRRLYYLPSHPP